MNNNIREYRQGDYMISTDKDRLQPDIIYNFLCAESYWAKNISLKIVERSIENSLTFGVYDKQECQVGFARVITDFAVFATLGDVFIVKGKRGLGLSKWLVSVIVSFPELKSIRRWTLYTNDAHKLYEKSGFRLLERPDLAMEINKPDIYEYYRE
ncbi:MAG: GNAT family N-acetyltransferase [Tannerella sp.]|jgi:GNAT superfamily N-acetyltransferase|nr:GNAT family N-acetyltransferase [Tannerella sp.]